MTVEFECRTPLAMPVEVAFARSLDIDLHVASMARSRERAIGGVTSGSIGLGEEVTWRAWHFGVPIRMTSRITELEAPHWFVDGRCAGRSGPIGTSTHSSVTGDGTLLIDHVVFDAPLGGLGRPAEAVIGPYLVRLIERRNSYLRDGSAP